MFKKYYFLISIIILFSLILRLLAISDYNFAFTWDQARDLIDIRRLVFAHRPLLVGPTTGLTGVFVGPFWYYFNALPILLSGGDPSSVVVWLVTWFLLAGIFIFYFFRNFHPFNFIFGTLFLFSPLYFHTTHYSLNPNLLPIFFLVLFSLLPYLTPKTNVMNFFWLGIFIGLSLQIEAAMAIIFLAFTFLYLLVRKVTKTPFFLLGFGLTLIPQFIYEFRHSFSMMSLVLNQLTGKEDYLTNKLTLVQKFLDLVQNYKQSLVFTFQLPLPLMIGLLVLSFIYLFKKSQLIPSKLKTTIKLLLIFYISSFIFYLIYPFRIYLWYLHSLGVVYIFTLSLLIYLLYKQRNLSGLLFSTTIFAYILISGSLWQIDFIKANSKTSNNPSNLKNRLTVIDTIYQKAEQKGFQVYTYSPAVYDLPFHYLFWWYGTKTYAYQPEVVHFNKGDHYLVDNASYWAKRKPMDDQQLTFLILEPGDHNLYSRESWFKQFDNLCLVDTQDTNFEITIQTKEKCSR